MSQFNFHSIESAPEGSKPFLEGAQRGFGFVPGLLAGLAESPATLEGYMKISGIYGKSSLSPVEQQVVSLTASFENGCDFCMGAHSFIARNMAKADDAIVDALRAGSPLPDAKLEALSQFTRAMVRERGWLGEQQQQAFLDAGYGRQQMLEVVLGVAMKTISNYANHLMETPLDAAFEAERWEKPADAA